jgi:C4-dicarboxylate-specific signal transduction histidine kinase
MLSVVNSGATDKVAQQRAKQQNTTSITAASAPEESTSQTGVQATEPARAAAIVWRDPLTPMTTAQDPVANPTAAPTEAAPTESVQSASIVKESADDAEHIAQTGASANGTGEMKASAVSELVKISLVAALGLMVAGFLFRVAMARRRRIIIDQSELHWMDDRNEHELSDRQQRSGSVHQLNERSYDLQRPLMPAAGDYRPRRPLQKDHEFQENPQRKGRDSDVEVAEISRRDDMFEQLRRDLDRLLQSPKVA